MARTATAFRQPLGAGYTMTSDDNDSTGDGKFHIGEDWAGKIGGRVSAAANGTVVSANNSSATWGTIYGRHAPRLMEPLRNETTLLLLFRPTPPTPPLQCLGDLAAGLAARLKGSNELELFVRWTDDQQLVEQVLACLAEIVEEIEEIEEKQKVSSVLENGHGGGMATSGKTVQA